MRIDGITNLRQMLYESCEIYKDNAAYLYKDEDKKYQEIKYSQVLKDVKAIRHFTDRHGT